jgi:NADPH:quinone reductase-like Zn-dependent oxidoreductase/acyl transferase domain-containing protein
VAIQISLVRLLVCWGVSPTAVTGHSSGEISAAYAAGALTFREAMVCAYFRGYLCNSLLEASDRRGGMLTLGDGKEVAGKYLQRVSSGRAMIACFNSPSSVTISGDVDAIDEIEAMAAADGIFARKLKVGCAYHSHHMSPMACEYERILSQHLQVGGSFDGILFSSPVTGGLLESARELGPAHWVDNMTKPVLFENSLREMIIGGEKKEQNIDMLIEIGPHGALGGPIRQILSLPGLENLDIPYATCLSRGQDAVKTMQGVACLLKVRGYDVNLEAVSFPTGSKVRRVIHDLPAYPWNHSVGYWYESPLHKRERVCEYEAHGLLGTRLVGSVPTEPTWRHRIRVSEMPWLRDHLLQSQMVFPGAGFVALAIEAFSQIYPTVSGSQGGYELRDVELLKALVIPDTTEGIDLQLLIRKADDENLNFKKGDKFHVYSLSLEGVWTEHCRGFICASSETAKQINQSSLLSQEISHGGHHLRKISPKHYYNSLQDIGPTFGPLFRNLQDIRATESMSLATFSVPEIACNTSLTHKSDLLIHPISLDTAFHAVYSAIPLAKLKQMGLTIPIFVKSLYVSSDLKIIPHSIFKTSVHVDKTTSEGFEASLDVTVDGATPPTALIKVEGMLCRSIDREPIENHELDPTLCLKTTWGGHLSFLTKDKLHYQLAAKMDPNESVIMGNLARAVFYISEEVLQSLTEEDQSKLEWHHKRLFDWMKHAHESSPVKWSLSTPEEKNSLLEEVSSQSINGEMLCRVGAKMMSILRKEVEPLTLMMEDSLLDRYYENALKLRRSLDQVEKLVTLFAHTNPRSRVLEIGAGTGVCTAPVLRALGAADENMPNPKLAQYDFTDISAGFFEAARERFGSLNGRMNYLKLDIEEDPESQSFKIGTYDLVVACQVLHATKNIQRTMQNVRKLLKPGGRLILVESTQDEVDIQMVFGTLPGWWLSEEPERMLSPTLTVDSWTSLLDRSGFGGLDIEVGDCENRQEYVMSVMMATASVELESPPRANIAVILPSKQAPPPEWVNDLTQLIQTTTLLDCSVHSMGQPEIRADAFIYLGDLDQPSLNQLTVDEFHNLKSLIGASQYALWITRGGVMNCESPLSALVTGFLRTLRLEDPSKRYISLDLDPVSDSWTPQATRAIVQILKNTFADSWKVQRTEYEFAERQGQILVPRICEDYEQNLAIAKQISEPETQAQCFHQKSTYLRLEAKSPGNLDSLVFSGGPDPLLADGMVEIIPHAFGLNFRDVLVAMGQMQEGFMGFECTGVVIAVDEASTHKFRVGDRVCALMTAGHWANRVQVPSTSVAHLPDDMPFELGASIPMIYITAYHALIEIAHLEKGETILIHAAAGGVGQAAISLAQHIGAEIFVTVGSPKKRDFVHNTYEIPFDHIYSSRDTSFAQGIMSITNGRGVDVILNSLSGKLLQASWDCIAMLGRFVEIGKRDIQQNRQLEMANFGRSVSFCAMDLVHLGNYKGEKVSRILRTVLRMIEEGDISPRTPITTFSISDLPQAFRTMQAGKHIGKIVVKADTEDRVNVSIYEF